MAANNVLMPKMGYDMAQGKIIRWLKKEGEHVEKGEAIAEIETEKVNIEIEAFQSGTILKFIAHEDDEVPVGQPIALIGEPGDKVPEEAPALAMPEQQEGAGEGGESQPTHVEVQSAGSEVPVAAEETRAEAVAAEPPAPPEPAEEGERLKVSPVARRFAQEQGVELTSVQGTGPGGRITKEDVGRFLTEAAGRRRPAEKAAARQPERPAPARSAAEQAAPAPARAEVPAPAPAQPKPAAPADAPATPPAEGVPAETRDLSRMGQAIARRMAESKRTIPHFYATVEIDMTHVANLREELNRTLSEQAKISFNDFVMKATAMALVRYPILNAAFEGEKLRIYKQVNLGMAIALEEGLIAPVLQACDQKPLAQISREAKELAAAAREGKLRQEQYEGATFTVSNMGMLGVEEFAAIIPPPQAGILAVGAVAPRPVVRDGKLAVSTTMKATVSVDHRVANGADGARFLQQLKELLEEPIRLLL